MRWNTKHTVCDYFSNRHRRLSNWHLWFAWYPVSLLTGSTEVTVWLEPVMRKGEHWNDVSGSSSGWYWEYKLPEE